jgi:hypothetical protein
LFPKRLSNFNHPTYFLLYLAITLAAGLANGYRYWQYSREIPEWPQTGHIGDILPGEYGHWHLVYMIGMNTFSIACYATIWAILRVKTCNFVGGGKMTPIPCAQFIALNIINP